MKSMLILFVCSSTFLLSCNKKSVNSNDAIRQIIIKKYEKVRATLKNGDPNYVLNMHSKDAVLFLKNGTQVDGIAALKIFYEKVAPTGIDIESTPTTIELLSENVAFEVGTFTSTSKTGIQNSAKYINIWKKTDGDWKLFKSIDQAKL